MISAYSYVYSFALAVHKYDASTNESLEGAEFAVYDNEDCEGDPIATFTTNSDGYGGYAGLGAGTYYVVETKAPSGYKRNSTPQEVTIDLDHRASGYYQFTRNVIEYTSDINESLYGIQAKDDSYNLLWIDPNDTTQVYTSQSKNYVPAYVKSISYEVTDGNYGCEGCVVLEFPNAEGKTLPTTGDMGVVPFIIAGSALMVGAVIVLITRKRMNGEDKETL
jgi:LPXTG-motif cell wall-anchored protein